MTRQVVVLWLGAIGAYAFYLTAIASYGSVFGSLAADFAFIVFVYI